MFPNLEAEQARQGHTNEFVASELGMPRQTYEHKKRVGTFKLKEINKLVKMYSTTFEYLFSFEPMMTGEKTA